MRDVVENSRNREIGTVERGYAVARMGNGVHDVLVTDAGRTAKPSPWEGLTGREIGRAFVAGRAAKQQETEPLPRLIVREQNAGIGDAAPTEDDELPTLRELGIGDAAGAQDPEPAVMSWYAGKPFSEGRAAHNRYLISTGRAPIPAGRR